MSAPDLNALVERIRAKEVCRELDADIAVALQIGVRKNLEGDTEALRKTTKLDGCAAGTYWFVCRSGMSLRTAPLFTSSLDAASSVFPAEAMYRSGHAATGPSTFFCDAVAPDGIASFHTLEETEVAARLIAALQMRAEA